MRPGKLHLKCCLNGHPLRLYLGRLSRNFLCIRVAGLASVPKLTYTKFLGSPLFGFVLTVCTEPNLQTASPESLAVDRPRGLYS